MRCLSLLATVFIFGAVFNTSVPAADIWWPGPDYPEPEKASAPAWLLSQKLNFSRWDGGPLEVCKGMLSGWPYFNAPWPGVVDATSRWYDPETVELAEAMGYNFIWLTFNVGYSIEKERHQWELLRAYVDACHARGLTYTRPRSPSGAIDAKIIFMSQRPEAVRFTTQNSISGMENLHRF